MTLETFGPIESAYGSLLVEHHNAARAGNEKLRSRIFDAIEVFEELWPQEAKRWSDTFRADGEVRNVKER